MLRRQFQGLKRKVPSSTLHDKREVKSAVSCWRLSAITLLTCSIALLCVGRTGYAAVLGDTIKPFASITEMYDSNIFRVKDQQQLRELNGGDKMGDFITILSAGTDVHYEISKQVANLTLRKDFMRYSHYSSQDASSDDAKADFNLAVIDRFGI